MDRTNLIHHLLTEEESANGQYIAGEMDRDSWAKTVQGIDDRLSVLGLRLAFRPWEGTETRIKF